MGRVGFHHQLPGRDRGGLGARREERCKRQQRHCEQRGSARAHRLAPRLAPALWWWCFLCFFALCLCFLAWEGLGSPGPKKPGVAGEACAGAGGGASWQASVLSQGGGGAGGFWAARPPFAATS